MIQNWFEPIFLVTLPVPEELRSNSVNVKDEPAQWTLQMTSLNLEHRQSLSISTLAPDAGSDFQVISSLFVHRVSSLAEQR